MFNVQDIMSELQSLGSEKKGKLFRQHGAGDNVYGVKYADLVAMRNRIGTNQALAEELWKTGNFDARVLAIIVADPRQMNRRLIESWQQDVNYHILGGQLAKLIGKTDFAREIMEEWMAATDELTSHCGYCILVSRLQEGLEMSDDEGKRYLEEIEARIHTAPNLTRYAMNDALITIGVQRPKLTKKAFKCAKRIGKVEIDYGENRCETPNAIEYLQKVLNKYEKVLKKRRTPKRN